MKKCIANGGAYDNPTSKFDPTVRNAPPLRCFYYAFRTPWYTENKPHGFQVQDVRLGGWMQRMQSCLDMLVDYRDGKLASISELEEEIVPFVEGVACFNDWAKATGTNL